MQKRNIALDHPPDIIFRRAFSVRGVEADDTDRKPAIRHIFPRSVSGRHVAWMRHAQVTKLNTG